MIEAGDKSGRKHFYISYAHADEAWAEWIAARLEEAGYQTIIKAWDFRPGSNLVLEIDYALQQADRTLLVLSPSYLCSDAFAEWAAVFREDPKGRQGQLLPVRVVLCNIKGLLGSIVPIDLVGLDEKRAAQRLLSGVLQARVRRGNPSFPGVSSPSSAQDGTEFSAIPDVQFATWTKPIEDMLKARDYNTAYNTIDRILQNYYDDLTARQRARLNCIQGLVYLKGHRPRNLLHSVVEAASSLIDRARREHPLYAYISILAAIEADSAQTGLPKANKQLSTLVGQAKELRTKSTKEDKEIIELFTTTQAELYKDFRSLF